MRPLLFLAAVLAALPATAQDDFRTIVVSGSGEAFAPSDRAVVSVSFSTEGATADEALSQHETEVARVRQILTEAGVPDGDVTLQRASVGPQGARGFPGSGSDDDAYSVLRQLTVRVDDLDAVPALVAALSTDADDDVLAVQVRNVDVSYVLADDGALRRAALRGAVDDARERAALIAEATGVTLGEVLDVSEGLASALGGDIVGLQAMMAGMQLEPGEGGEHRVGASVVVTFRIR